MLIPCVECQSQVSDTASACPNCGMRNPNWRFNHQIPCVECQSQVSDTASACPNCGMQNPNWRFNHQNDERDIFKVINAQVARIKALPVEGQKEIKANIGVCNMFSTPIMLAMMLITIMMLYWFFTDNLVYAGKALYPAGITYILGFIMYQIENRIVERTFAKYENNR